MGRSLAARYTGCRKRDNDSSDDSYEIQRCFFDNIDHVRLLGRESHMGILINVAKPWLSKEGTS